MTDHNWGAERPPTIVHSSDTIAEPCTSILLRANVKLPFKLTTYQEEVVQTYSTAKYAGYYAEVGTGKTVMATASAILKRLCNDRLTKTIVIGPPILCRQWANWLRQFGRLPVLIYEGSPAQRKELKPTNYAVTVMSIQLFKSDLQRLMKDFEPFRVTLIVDEATSIKSISSDNHKAVKKFLFHISTRDWDNYRDLILLTGTPLTTPLDAYSYTKLTGKTYRTQTEFLEMHVAERDHFGNVTKYKNLEELQKRFLTSAFRVLKEEANPQMPDEVYDPILYDLSSSHYALYKKLALEQLLLLEDGRKIDATTPNRLFHALQQVILAPEEYCDTFNAPDVTCVELIENTLEDLDGRKLLIAANYQKSIANLLRLLQKYGAVSINGVVSESKKQANLQRFLNDKDCRVMILQPTSGGYGIDGLQHVCTDLFFAELPVTPKDFHQVVGRLKRTGQKQSVHVRIAVAEETLQVRLQQRFLVRDELVNVVQLSYQDLRNAIYGE